jgi:hypothetical protein
MVLRYVDSSALAFGQRIQVTYASTSPLPTVWSCVVSGAARAPIVDFPFLKTSRQRFVPCPFSSCGLGRRVGTLVFFSFSFSFFFFSFFFFFLAVVAVRLDLVVLPLLVGLSRMSTLSSRHHPARKGVQPPHAPLCSGAKRVSKRSDRRDRGREAESNTNTGAAGGGPGLVKAC